MVPLFLDSPKSVAVVHKSSTVEVQSLFHFSDSRPYRKGVERPVSVSSTYYVSLNPWEEFTPDGRTVRQTGK